MFRQRLGAREWLPAAAMTAGLAGLLFMLAPASGGAPRVHWYGWLAGVGANLGLVGCLVVWARRAAPAPSGDEQAGQRGAGGRGFSQQAGSLRAAVLAVAAGATFGLTAALMKAMTRTLHGGLGHLFTDWPLYAMVAAGVFGMFLTQSALNAGQLIAAQPGLTLSDPLISVLWGVLVFHETVREGWFIAGEAGCAAVIVAGVIMLARSPLLSGDGSAEEEQSGEAGAEGRRHAPVRSET